MANEKPLSQPPFADAGVQQGYVYRYVVRSRIEADDTVVWSLPSEEVEVLFHDRFPPATPTGLRLILEGTRAVNLLWNPNTEPDLAGYGVYRRAGTAEWQRIDGGRTKTATFVDGGMQAGQQYEYAVTAYDATVPPNESEKTAAKAVQR